MYSPYADAAGMLIHIHGTFTLGKLKPKNSSKIPKGISEAVNLIEGQRIYSYLLIFVNSAIVYIYFHSFLA